MVQLVIGPLAPRRWFKGLEGGVGQIYVDITVSNFVEETNLANGLLPAGTLVPTVSLSRVLFDTGATTLCLPADLVAALNLPFLRNAVAETATGHHLVCIFGAAQTTLMGRSTATECVELPEGAPPLLGVLPLEQMGIEPNLRDEILELRPEPWVRI